MNEKEKIVQNIIRSGSSQSSKFINQILFAMPPSIALEELVYQPLEKTIRPDASISYTTSRILVGGQSANNEAFGSWSRELKELDWVRDIVVSKYSQNAGTLTEFELIITIP